jgi:hypothetical protein
MNLAPKGVLDDGYEAQTDRATLFSAVAGGVF